ncbi:hypothetical protein AGMMS49992_26810 [Clostridia bacterium]|nr:hypothetical protein AGMMS49992_26810 [Clostridia bacterium]
MKTLKETIKGLDCCGANDSYRCGECAFRGEFSPTCVKALVDTARNHTLLAQAEIERLMRERDAAVKDMYAVVARNSFGQCYECAHYHKHEKIKCDIPHIDCRFEWRGPCAENGGVDDSR